MYFSFSFVFFIFWITWCICRYMYIYRKSKRLTVLKNCNFILSWRLTSDAEFIFISISVELIAIIKTFPIEVAIQISVYYRYSNIGSSWGHIPGFIKVTCQGRIKQLYLLNESVTYSFLFVMQSCWHLLLFYFSCVFSEKVQVNRTMCAKPLRITTP